MWRYSPGTYMSGFWKQTNQTLFEIVCKWGEVTTQKPDSPVSVLTLSDQYNQAG